MTNFVGAALTCAGATAEPTASELISTAANALTTVRLRFVLSRHFHISFFPRRSVGGHGPVYSRAVPNAENRRKLLEWAAQPRRLGGIRHPTLAQFATSAGAARGTSARRRGFRSSRFGRRGMTMLGKIAGALIGRKLIGNNRGAKGALIGVGVAALARRGLGPLATVAAVGYGAKKLCGMAQAARRRRLPVGSDAFVALAADRAGPRHRARPCPSA